MQTILLATDGSPTARKATETAYELARASHWRLHVLSVWQVPVFPYDYPSLKDLPQIAEIERLRARTAVQHAVEEARSLGIQAIAETREGDPVDEICETAAET
jgi:nucleotide-binding universal stress UspA family protein